MVDLKSLVRRYKLSKMSDNVLSDNEIKVCNFLIGYLNNLVSYIFDDNDVYFGSLETDKIVFYVHNNDLIFSYNSMVSVEVIVYDLIYGKEEDFMGHIDCDNLVKDMIDYIYPEYIHTNIKVFDLINTKFSKYIEANI